MQENTMKDGINGYKPYLKGIGAWALALGGSVGWGSVVVTCNSYLAQAGPLGSVLGLLLGTVIMLVIARNYHCLINAYPEAGGAYSYSKEILGHDHGFLTAWFLFLVYIAVFWANATSLPLFARYFLGGLFQFGFRYSVFGYEIYLGEIILTLAAMLAVSVICISRNRIVQLLMIILMVLACVCLGICAIVSFVSFDSASFSLSPLFIPGKNRLLQCLMITSISPWAFIGFENISHSASEFTFPRKKSMVILGISVISAAVLYLFVIMLSVTAYPPEYSGWMEYINDRGNLTGIKALPAFYAAEHYLGKAGVGILMAALLALVLTSMISNMVALGRLVQSVSADRLLPEGLSVFNGRFIPARAILFIMIVSVPVTLLGRTAIGWIVDVTTIGATLIYGLVSVAALKLAKESGDRKERFFGLAGLICMLIFGILLLLPNIISVGAMAGESYILFTIWSVSGFLFFRSILIRDKASDFGRSIIVWISLLSLILLTSLIWMNQSSIGATNTAIVTVKAYYDAAGVMIPGEEEFITDTLEKLHNNDIKNMAIVVALFTVALSMLITNYRLMSRRTREKEDELDSMRDTAYKDPLTGVKSKHAFSEMEEKVNEKIRAGRMDEFAIIVCDVNGLKHVNDTRGHKAGDDYIREACMTICRVFDHSPVFRTGGDEFVVLATGSDYDNREALIAEFNRIVEDNIPAGKVVVSAGISVFEPADDDKLHSVFARADALMYERKKALKAMGAKTRE